MGEKGGIGGKEKEGGGRMEGMKGEGNKEGEKRGEGRKGDGKEGWREGGGYN